MGLKVWTLFMNLSYKNFQDFILFQLSDFAHWVYFNNKSYKSLLRDSISRPIAPQWQAETKPLDLAAWVPIGLVSFGQHIENHRSTYVAHILVLPLSTVMITH
jgi:hypothetical protein